MADVRQDRQWRRGAGDAWLPLDDSRRAALVELAIDHGEAWRRPPPPGLAAAPVQARLTLGQGGTARVQLARAGGYLLWSEGDGPAWALEAESPAMAALLARLGL